MTHDVEESLLLSNEIIVMSRAPVRILTRQTLDIPVPERILGSTELGTMKNTLIQMMEE